ELAPHVGVPGDGPAWYGQPLLAVPILHLEVGDPVETKLLRRGRSDGGLISVLDREDVHFSDRLEARKIDLEPVSGCIPGRAIPATATAPVDAGALTVNGSAGRIPGVPERRCGSRGAFSCRRHVNACARGESRNRERYYLDQFWTGTGAARTPYSYIHLVVVP